MSTVCVIGGSGFLGSHLADALSAAGHSVRIFDRQKSAWRADHQQMIIGDLMDNKALRSAVDGCNAVYHLAGIADIGESSQHPVETLETNIIGSAHVAEACIDAGVQRLLFASSVYVYSTEGSFYRVSKQAAEQMLATYAKERGLSSTVLRYGSLYGPRSQPWNGLHRYVAEALKNGRIEYAGTGEERREFIHVQDAARLSVDALAEEYAGRCLTITGTQPVTTGELLQMIGEILPDGLDVSYHPERRSSLHYAQTPYRFTPNGGEKMVATVFRDLGQGILELIEEVYNRENGNA